MLQVTFTEFASVLQACAAALDAAEGHGCLCGALCTGADYTYERWLQELLPDEDRELGERDARTLQLLFDETVRSLRGDEMDFAPLLPGEDDALELRASTMAEWSRGFLYGFGIGGALPPGSIPPAVDEVLRDVAQIGGAVVDVGAAGEEEEEAYTEVFEYLRVGVQLVHDELRTLREGKPAALADDDVPLSQYGNEDDFDDLPRDDDELH
jgi:uncharacterized protein YgfB (UPF0149 family)